MKKLTYSLWDVLMADPDKPITEEKRQHQLTRMYIALDQIEKGDNPTVDDLALVSDAVELTDSFYHGEMTTLEPDNELTRSILEARRALIAAYIRHRTGAAIRLTGTGMQAVRSVMDRYYALLEVIPERTLIQLHRATEKANIEALNNGRVVILKEAIR